MCSHTFRTAIWSERQQNFKRLAGIVEEQLSGAAVPTGRGRLSHRLRTSVERKRAGFAGVVKDAAELVSLKFGVPVSKRPACEPNLATRAGKHELGAQTS